MRIQPNQRGAQYLGQHRKLSFQLAANSEQQVIPRSV